MTTNSSTTSDSKIACRYCGHRDTPKFCSQCGSRLDNITSPSLLQYIWYRLDVVIEYISRLTLTWFLLTARPRQFFKTLNNEGTGIHEIHVFYWKNGRRTFRRSRLPITAQGYFFFVVVVLTALNVFDVKSAEEEVKSSRFDNLPFGLGDHVGVALPPVLMEVILVLLLFSSYGVYRLLLRKKNSPQFMEYFLYTFSHVVICVLMIVGVLEALDADAGVSDMVFLVGCFVLSTYYYLGILLHLAKEPFLALERKIILITLESKWHLV